MHHPTDRIAHTTAFVIPVVSEDKNPVPISVTFIFI